MEYIIGEMMNIIATMKDIITPMKYNITVMKNIIATMKKLTNGSNVNIPIFVILDRGYTGHEHLQSAGLIHMNARLYDPLLGRFVSPDNYVQDPLGTQNYNRYAYAMNNPLVYVDQNGEFFELFGLVNLFTNIEAGHVPNFWSGLKAYSVGAAAAIFRPEIAFKAATATTIAHGSSLYALLKGDGWDAIDMNHRLAAGLFHYDNNRNFTDQFFSAVMRNSEEIQSVIGYGYSQIQVSLGNAARVDYFGGATFVTDEFGGYGGMSLGNYINVNIRDEITGSFKNRVLSDPLFMHEYGHTFDSQFWGPLYLFTVGIPSWLSAKNSEKVSVGGLQIQEHDFKSFERRANKYAAQYFGQYYNISWHKYEPPRNSFPLRKRKYYNP